MTDEHVVLIYKRTHKGDPCKKGIFGINNCMGSVRGWKYNAVIGIGGKRPWKMDKDIAYKINWIGITPYKHQTNVITFEHFCLYEEDGVLLEEIAPKLHNYMYSQPTSPQRFVKSTSLSKDIREEINSILKMAENCERSICNTKQDVEKEVKRVKKNMPNQKCENTCRSKTY